LLVTPSIRSGHDGVNALLLTRFASSGVVLMIEVQRADYRRSQLEERLARHCAFETPG
jgi:hypothetical protein